MTDLTLAEQLRDDPSPEVQEVLDSLPDASIASQSTVQTRFRQEDGSILVALSKEGDPAEMRTYVDDAELQLDREI